MQSEPVSDEELTKARNQKLRNLVTESLTVESKAAALGSAAVLEGDVGRINTQLKRIRDVTAADIQRVAQKYLDLEHVVNARVNRNLLGALGSLFGMKDDVEDAAITGLKELAPPVPGRSGVTRPSDRDGEVPLQGLLQYDPAGDYALRTLNNGMKIVVVENHEVPFVSVQLGLTAGAWNDPRPGTASMTLSMLTKGTQERTEAELSEELDRYAISLSGSASTDTSRVNLSCLPEQIDRGLELMADVVLRPTMPPEEFRKLKDQTLTGLAISTREPSYIADREFRRRIFGDHPYAHATEGEPEDIKSLEVDDLKTWWQIYARPDLATLIFAGDINLERAEELAQKYFASWQATGDSPLAEIPSPPAPTATHIFLVDNRGVQSQIRVGQLGFTRADPDYFTSRVVSGYFGGAFSSRLNETIRVEKGLTYGARGGFTADKSAGEFQVSTFSKNATTVEAVQAILDEVQRLQTEPPSQKELNNTISYIVGSYPSDRETPQQVAGDIWLQQSMDLPQDYFRKMLSAVANTTQEDCLKLAQDRIDPDKLIIVVVGPAKTLQAGLEQIAPVTVVK